MGFGVSGSTAVVFVALLISAGTLYTSASSTAQTLTDARDEKTDRLLQRQNTAVTVTAATYDAGTDTLIVRATNNGTTSLSVNDTTVLVDNEVYPTANATVDGTAATDLWLPGETLALNLTVTSTPARVKLVTEVGVADARGV